MDVFVVDFEHNFVEKVAPAVARYALKNKFAHVSVEDPFTIRLIEGLRYCPRPQGSGKKIAPEIVRVRSNNMDEQIDFMEGFSDVNNVESVFERVAKENGGDGNLWAIALRREGNPASQVFLQVKDKRGKHIKIPAVHIGKPVLLAPKYASVLSFYEDSDVKTFVDAGVLRLMTTKDALASVGNEARREGVTSGQLLQRYVKAQTDAQFKRASFADQAAETQSSGMIKTKVPTQKEIEITLASQENEEARLRAHAEETYQPGELASEAEDIIHPRVVHLCSRIDPNLAPNQRMAAKAFELEITEFDSQLTFNDMRYIKRHASVYPSLVKWAKLKMVDMIDGEE